MIRTRIACALACVPVVLAGPAMGQDTGKKLYAKMLQASGWVHNAAGNDSGTAWVVDRSQRLMLTNWHVVVKADAVTVTFPESKDGRVISERSYYQDPKNNVVQVRAQVIDGDSKRDLALLQLDSLPDGTGELKLAAEGASPGDHVYTVGNPSPSGSAQLSDPLWVFTDGKVGAVARQQISYGNTGQQLDVNMLLTTAPINPGDSGGCVINSGGEIVGIISGTRAGKNNSVTLAVELGEVNTFLQAARQWLNPKTVADYSKRAQHYYSAARYSAAIADYTTLVKANPKDADSYHNRAEAQMATGAYAAAIADFGQALRLNPKDAVAYGDRGVSYGRLGEYDQAVADLTQCLALSPKIGVAYRFRGTFLRAQGNADKALADFNDAIRLTPNDIEAYYQRGLVYEDKGDLDSAITDFDKAV